MIRSFVEPDSEGLPYEKESHVDRVYVQDREHERRTFLCDVRFTVIAILLSVALFAFAVQNPVWNTRVERLISTTEAPSTEEPTPVIETCTRTVTVGIWQVEINDLDCPQFNVTTSSQILSPSYMCKPCDENEDELQAELLSSGSAIHCIPSPDACRLKGKTHPCSRLERYCLETQLAPALSIVAFFLLFCALVVVGRITFLLRKRTLGPRHPCWFALLAPLVLIAAVTMMIMFRELSDDLGSYEVLGFIPRERTQSPCAQTTASRGTVFAGEQVEVCYQPSPMGAVTIVAASVLGLAGIFLLKNACGKAEPPGALRAHRKSSSFRSDLHGADDEESSKSRVPQHPFLHSDVAQDNDVLDREGGAGGALDLHLIRDQLDKKPEQPDPEAARAGLVALDMLENAAGDGAFGRTPLPSWARSSDASLSAIGFPVPGFGEDGGTGKGDRSVGSRSHTFTLTGNYASISSSARRNLLEEDTDFLLELLKEFYAIHDTEKPVETIHEVVHWARKTGIKELNRVLKEKYGKDLDSFAQGDPRHRGTPEEVLVQHGSENPLRLPFADGGKSHGGAQLNEVQTDVDDPFDEVDVESTIKLANSGNAVDNDKWPLSKIRLYVYAFCRAYDPRQLGGGVDQIVIYAKRNGIKRLNARLFKMHEADIFDIHPNFVERERVTRELLFQMVSEYYEKHDPTRSKVAIVEIVEWTMRHGVGSLHKKLTEKYGTGLKLSTDTVQKLGLADALYRFFAAHDSKKPLSEVKKFIAGAKTLDEQEVKQTLLNKYKLDLSEVEVNMDASEGIMGSFWNTSVLNRVGAIEP